MKEVYSFNINKKVTREVSEETENGKLVKKIEDEVPVKVIFKKPNRIESEEADTVYAVEYGRCVRAGILTKALVQKLYDEKEKSGILSDNFADKYITLYEKFYDIQNEYTKLSLKDDQTEDDKRTLSKLAIDFGRIRNELQTLEAARNNIFQNTAETKAENKTILWMTLFLTYIQENDSIPPIPLFEGNTFEEKLSNYDKVLESEDEFLYKIIDKMAYFVALYYMGRASSKEDFLKIEKSLESELEPELEPDVEGENTDKKDVDVKENKEEKEEITEKPVDSSE